MLQPTERGTEKTELEFAVVGREMKQKTVEQAEMQGECFQHAEQPAES